MPKTVGEKSPRTFLQQLLYSTEHFPGDSTIAFGASILAQGAGNVQGRVDAYRDQVAQQADMARLNEQQAEFDKQQQESAREFDGQQKIRTAQEQRAETDATRTNRKRSADYATYCVSGNWRLRRGQSDHHEASRGTVAQEHRAPRRREELSAL